MPKKRVIPRDRAKRPYTGFSDKEVKTTTKASSAHNVKRGIEKRVVSPSFVGIKKKKVMRNYPR